MFAVIYEGFGMSLFLLLSSVLVSSWGLSVPAWSFLIPFGVPFWTPKSPKMASETLKGTAENEDLLSWALLSARGPLL